MTKINKIPIGYLKLKEAAKYLNMNEKTFRKYVFPIVKSKKVGRCYYFSIDELDKFMKEGLSDEMIKVKVKNLLQKIGA